MFGGCGGTNRLSGTHREYLVGVVGQSGTHRECLVGVVGQTGHLGH